MPESKNKKDDKNKEVDRSISPLGPESHFMSLRDAMNRLFDESFWDPFDNFFGPHRQMISRVSFPKVDVSETGKEVRVVADIPGVDPDNVDIEVDEDVVTLSGQVNKETEEKDKDKKYYRFERECGEFKRVVPLPARVSPDKVSAKHKNGVLTVTLPKVSPEKKRKVKIESD